MTGRSLLKAIIERQNRRFLYVDVLKALNTKYLLISPDRSIYS